MHDNIQDRKSMQEIIKCYFIPILSLSKYIRVMTLNANLKLCKCYQNYYSLLNSQNYFLAYPNLQLNSFFIFENRFYFEIDPNRAYKCRCKGIISISEQEGGFSNTAVADNEQFEHVIKVLVRCIFLAISGILNGCHL